MIPQDKFGNPIYEHIFKVLQENGRVLALAGFKESRNKPNLFFLKDEEKNVVFFADMRSTGDVPIWEDTRPLIYGKFLAEHPEWKKRRIMTGMFQLLLQNGCECRFEDDLLVEHGEDGYCKLCGKDFQADGLYCSKECEKADEETYKDHCAVCGRSLDRRDVIRHHVSYKEEKTIPVCRSCHLKIHKSQKMPNLKPDEEDKKKFYERKRNCEYCGQEFKSKKAVERHEKVCYKRYRQLAMEHKSSSAPILMGIVK
ncbi:MAG: HNH endonuclease [Candidatus Aenigmarchaeota archaeon]|nr:HNH endonuclease [Candidatus Aenigmarchaeota archaeon]